MSGWETLQCENHPERIALERCEVCQKPLCAYCLYYTEDGQRLCADHAAVARQRGIRVEDPGAYAEQLIGAQAAALRKHKRGAEFADDNLYRGNSNDLMGFLGMILGLTALGACCGAGYCLPGVGLLLSLAALINAKRAFDPKRTRRFALIGLVVSGIWVLIIGACIAFYGFSIRQLTNSIQPFNFPTQQITTNTPTPTDTGSNNPPARSTLPPTWTAEPTRDTASGMELDSVSLTETAEAPSGGIGR